MAKYDGLLCVKLTIATLDATNAKELQEELRPHCEAAQRCHLDISKVDFIDSSGIGCLLNLFKANNKHFVLFNPSPNVLSVIELLHLHKVFPIERGDPAGV